MMAIIRPVVYIAAGKGGVKVKMRGIEEDIFVTTSREQDRLFCAQNCSRRYPLNTSNTKQKRRDIYG
jgi:hypothetical protein